jgi:hypothetical protein
MDSQYLAESAADSLGLERLLTPVLETAFTRDVEVPKQPGGLQILDLACGPCREVRAVTVSLQNAVRERAGDVRFVGAERNSARRKRGLAGCHPDGSAPNSSVLTARS